LPPVASQPVGGVQPQSAGSQLAWVDQSGGAQVLPAGYVLGAASSGRPVRFSVEGVTGTFQSSLPDAVPHGIHALEPSANLVSELAALVRGTASDGAAASGATDRAIAGGDGVELHESGAAEWSEEAIQIALSPSSLSLGMVAGIGVAGAMNASSRRRNSNWLQQTFEVLGLS